MMFEGPESVDYRNVSALNRAYLSLLSSDRSARQSLQHLSPPLLQRITSLTRHQADRLAATPFMLLSFREQDDRLWSQIFADRRGRDLFSASVTDDYDRLRSAGLGFVWQLARQNPYTLRLICGASLHWCEQIAERTVFGLLAAAAPHADLLQLRRAHDSELWRKLLDDGICRESSIRTAAHVSALQTMLTRPADPVSRPWAVAACKTTRPGLRVAEEE
jgi:hypothetical protein